jgi:UDP-galactopyranose mutase
MFKKYDFLVVGGGGLFGCTFANQVNKLGKRVLIVEARNHLGGNDLKWP